MARKREPEQSAPYNPIADLGITYDIIVQRISNELNKQPVFRLTELPDFTGAGIYALYYFGEHQPFDEYEALCEDHLNRPIYLGKADPPGSRKGELEVAPNHTKLHDRINQHRSSITQASNLDPRDFYARFLVLDEVWIPLAERMLIRHYKPLWVTYIDGFGNHDPGKGRGDSETSMWDTIHPGRKYLARHSFPANARTPGEIRALITAVLAGGAVPELPEELVEAEASSDEEDGNA